MRRRLPSIMALQAFEASARLQSFTEAARECCLTAGAISRQVRLLEAELGIALFQRQSGRLVLSGAGQTYLQDIAGALGRIEEAGLRAGQRAGDGGWKLSIATLPGFGARWLMPRYPAFAAQQPDIAVTFYTRTEPVDFDQHRLDAAIHFGVVPPARVQADWLMAEEQVAVCCPSLRHLDAMPALKALARYRLLYHLDRPAAWDEWLGDGGPGDSRQPPGPAFEQMHLMIEAALSGLGLALVPRFIVQRELALGLLVEPFARRVFSRCHYWLIYPASSGGLPSLRMFRAWLLGQARDGQADAGTLPQPVPQPRTQAL